MPTILREAGFRFHFFSADGSEPPHVHVEAGGRKVKIWLQGVRVARNGGFNEPELARILAIVAERQIGLLEAWNDYCE